MTPLFRRASLALLLTCAALVARDDEQLAADFRLGTAVLAQLEARDVDGFLALLDPRGFVDEGAARGAYTNDWDGSTEEQRAAVVEATVRDLLQDGAQFFFHATLADVRPLPDPDAGRGPRPDRRYLNLLAAIPLNGRVRELLVMVGDDGRLLQAQLGEEYGGMGEELGEPRLQPSPLPSLENEELRWPDAVSRADRDDARAWVADLDDPDARLDAQDELFAWPHAAVPALLEAVRAWIDGADDAPANVQLVTLTLEQLTGRPLRVGTDLAASEAQLASWLAWHRRHGADFDPLDLPADLVAALEERDGSGGGDALSRWEELLAAQQAEAAGGPPAVAPKQASKPAEPESSTPPTPAPSTPPTPPPSTPPIPAPGGAPRPAPDSSPSAAPRAPSGGSSAGPVLLPALETLEVVVEGKRVAYPKIHDALDDGRRKRLQTWAADIDRLGLSVALGEREEHLVLGFVDDKELAAATAKLDAAAEHMEPLIPKLAKGDPKPTMVLLLDPRTARDDARWERVLDTLLDQRVLFEASADALRRDPGGLTLRAFPFVIQPTWDMAGNAAAGDDEFRLANELSHKLAVCMLSDRVGQLPDGLRWGLGHLAEMDMQGTVYQFNRTGFVSTDDHFDWDRKADRWIDKRASKRDFSFAERVERAGRDNPLVEDSALAWSVVDYLCHERTEAWLALLEALTALQQEKDAYGVATRWLPDDKATRALLVEHLDALDPRAISRHLKTHDR